MRTAQRAAAQRAERGNYYISGFLKTALLRRISAAPRGAVIGKYL